MSIKGRAKYRFYNDKTAAVDKFPFLQNNLVEQKNISYDFINMEN